MTTPGSKQAFSPQRALVFLLCLSATMAVLFDLSIYRLIFANPLQDQSWLLYVADRVLHGTQLYGPKLMEANPPLIVWFSTLPTLLARLFHGSSLIAFQVIVDLLIVVSSLWLARLLHLARIIQQPLILWVAFLIALAIESVPIDSSDFGQREHLLIILLLPYVLSAIFNLDRVLSVPEKIAIGFAAGIAISFKPQQTVVVIGLELFLVLWYRSIRRLWRPDLLSLAATVGTYIALAFLLAPTYFRIIPILRIGYLGGVTTPLLLKSLALFFVCWPCVFLFWLWKRPGLRFPLAPLALLVCSLCSAVAYCIQHKAFRYQAIPQNIFLLLAAIWLLCEVLRPSIAQYVSGLRLKPTLAYTALFVLLFSPPLLLHGRKELAAWRTPTFAQTVLSQYPPGTPVDILSTNISGFPLVLQDHLFWASRYAHLWLLPSIVHDELALAGQDPSSPAAVRIQQLAVLQRDTVTEDLHQWKPAVILVERCNPTSVCLGFDLPSFDILAWFQRSPSFSAEWKNYRRQPGDNQYDVYKRIN